MIETSISTLQLEESLIRILATEGKIGDGTDESLLIISDSFYSNATVLLRVIRAFAESHPNKKFKIEYESRGEESASRVLVTDSGKIEEIDDSIDNPTVELLNVKMLIAPAMINLLSALSESLQQKTTTSYEKIANKLRKLCKGEVLESKVAGIFLEMLNVMYGY